MVNTPSAVPSGTFTQETQAITKQKVQFRRSEIHFPARYHAAAIAQMIDQDELVQQERDKLQEMQRQWEAKLRQAEIDVSLERARLARQRQELEQRNAELEEQLCHQSRESQQAPAEAGKPTRRWLTKLGLTDDQS